MRIVTLVEDNLDEVQKKKGLCKEHGLSFFVETGKYRFLFDVGMSSIYRDNATKLGIDVSGAEFLVISHGHYDHGGGLKYFLEITKDVPIYLKQTAFGDYFSQRITGLKYIGLEKELKEAYNSRFVYTGDFLRINEEISVFSVVKPNVNNLPYANKVLKRLVNTGEYVYDDFGHEQNLVIETEDKSILMSACSHCGIVNILERFTELYGKRPDVVIGGLHLTNPQTLECEAEDKLEGLAEYLLQGNTRYYIGHCTGDKAFEYLKCKLGSRIEKLAIGEEIGGLG